MNNSKGANDPQQIADRPPPRRIRHWPSQPSPRWIRHWPSQPLPPHSADNSPLGSEDFQKRSPKPFIHKWSGLKNKFLPPPPPKCGSHPLFPDDADTDLFNSPFPTKTSICDGNCLSYWERICVNISSASPHHHVSSVVDGVRSWPLFISESSWEKTVRKLLVGLQLRTVL